MHTVLHRYVLIVGFCGETKVVALHPKAFMLLWAIAGAATGGSQQPSLNIPALLFNHNLPYKNLIERI